MHAAGQVNRTGRAENVGRERQHGGCDDQQQEQPLTSIPIEEQLTLEFVGISAWVPAHFQQPSLLRRAATKLQECARSSAAAGRQLLGRQQQQKQRRQEEPPADLEAGGGKVEDAGAETWQQQQQQQKAAAPPTGGGVGGAKRQVLHGLSGCVRPGELLALMGPSGSGKTSLLSVLGGRVPGAMEVSGHVRVNGQAYTKATRRRIGFVLQVSLGQPPGRVMTYHPVCNAAHTLALVTVLRGEFQTSTLMLLMLLLLLNHVFATHIYGADGHVTVLTVMCDGAGRRAV